MNLGEAKKRALSIMDEYSINGVAIPKGENEDYLIRMSHFASDAQMEISDKIKIEASYTIIQEGVKEKGYNKYDLPDDFKEHRYINLDDQQFTDYRIENRKLLIPKWVNGTLEHFYYKNPEELTEETPDDYEFEVEKHTQSLIPYYMAAMAIQEEDATIADRLLNLYYSKLQSIYKGYFDYPNYIESVYTM